MEGSRGRRSARTARALRAAPRVAFGVVGRLFDRSIEVASCAWPGYTRYYRREIRHLFGIFNDKGLGLINANRLDFEKVYVQLSASADVNLNRDNVGLIAEP